MRMLSDAHRKDVKDMKKKCYKLVSGCSTINDLALKVRNYGMEVKFLYKKNLNEHFVVSGKDLKFNVVYHDRRLLKLGRHVSMALEMRESDIETLYSLKHIPYRFHYLGENKVMILNYDWSKEQ